MDRTVVSAELPPAIAAAIDRGATIVTGNQRAARSIRQAYDRRQRAAGHASWRPPQIVAWDSWIAGLWQELLLEGRVSSMLLSRTQEDLVWQSIISDDRKNLQVLRSVDSLAQLASEAWYLIAQYGAEPRLKALAVNFEARSYMRWAGEFDRRCRVNKWISSASVEKAVIEFVRSGDIVINEVYLVGFDDLTPLRRSLIAAIGASTFPLAERPVQALAESVRMTVAEDEFAEIEAAARWARDLIQMEPTKAVAVIVPSLETRRPSIERIFREVLSPELQNIASDHEDAAYEFSVGVPLTQTALARTALDLLRWAYEPISLVTLSALAVSPYLAMTEGDEEVRAIFDAFEVRRAKMLLRPEVSIRWLLAMNSHPRKRPLPLRLASALEALVSAAGRYGIEAKDYGYGRWSEIFRKLLREAAWCNGVTLSSYEFQTRKRWESSLDELASLDFMSGQVSYSDALTTLEKICKKTIFAPESRQAPVQILGPLESAGSSFDAIWFVGAGDLTWPSKHLYNPLLPWTLQKELGMPGEVAADNDRNVRIAQRIGQSAATVVFSYATAASAGKQRLSSTIASLNPSNLAIEVLSPADAVKPSTGLEGFTDVMPLPVTPEDTIQGGSEILKLQAACGFRAFAEKRLLSADLRSVTLGLDSMERGTIVHNVLEFFWRETESQENLRLMTQEQRYRTIENAVDEGLRRFRQKTEAEWDIAYLRVQRERLVSLLSTWIKTELAREPFSVRSSEKEFKDVAVGPLRLTVRVDRVDETEAGDVIIDYKTGRAKPSDWLTERPDAPQLPLYAVISSAQSPERTLADIAFAKIHAGNDATFEALAGKISKGVWSESRKRVSIAEQLEEWRFVLTGLAEDFHSGDARVDPKRYPNTCKHCSQRVLCRLDPTAIEIDEEMNDEQEIQ